MAAKFLSKRQNIAKLELEEIESQAFFGDRRVGEKLARLRLRIPMGSVHRWCEQQGTDVSCASSSQPSDVTKAVQRYEALAELANA